MKKAPWGIIAGVCAIAVFYLTAGFIGSYYVLNGIAGQTQETASLFGEWFQVLMFVSDIVFVLAFGGALTMFVLKAKGVFDERQS